MEHLKKWATMVNSNILVSLIRYKHPVLVVRYEDLKRDEAGEVRRMLEFLQVAYSEERLGASYTHFYRNHTDTFKHFTPEQKNLINAKIKSIGKKLEEAQAFKYADMLLDYVR